MRFQPTAPLAALASRRLKRVPLGGLLRGRSENRICGIMMATMPF
jgi:hypothetical protein